MLGTLSSVMTPAKVTTLFVVVGDVLTEVIVPVAVTLSSAGNVIDAF